MTTWILVCTNCHTPNEVPREEVTVKCGEGYFEGRCIHCKRKVKGQQEYWRWLGLEEGPPQGGTPEQG